MPLQKKLVSDVVYHISILNTNYDSNYQVEGVKKAVEETEFLHFGYEVIILYLVVMLVILSCKV